MKNKHTLCKVAVLTFAVVIGFVMVSCDHLGIVPGERPENPDITRERAIEIAYADLAVRGIDAAYRSNSGVDRERGQLVWELLFRTTGERMPFIEYYINAENGNIVKLEWDD